jgi:hypothetical protein
MFSRVSLALIAAMLSLSSPAESAETWTLLRAGMNREVTTTTLGDPLFKNVARGFECWIYDGGAEVVCYRGLVVAWTTPLGVSNLAGRQLDLRAFQPQPAKVIAPRAAQKAATDSELELAPERQMRLPRL